MVPCIYCVGNKSISFDSGEFYCQWCNDTRDDAVRIERENHDVFFQAMMADMQFKDAALNWWFDYNDEEDRLEMLDRGLNFKTAYENYLSEMADVE